MAKQNDRRRPHNKRLPRQFVDAHHHFLDTRKNDFQSFLASLLPPHSVYTAKHYQRDVIQPLHAAGCEFVGSVHVECIPDCGIQEAMWVQQQQHASVQAIVASCDLTATDADKTLQDLLKIQKVTGIRWILDYVGEDCIPTNATHVATTRHTDNDKDYLRRVENPLDFHLLAQYNLTFDLQCAPEQLLAAAALCERYPQVPVVVDHLGKPRLFRNDDNNNTDDLDIWKTGMQQLSRLSHVHVKVSMLGFAVPGWYTSRRKRAVVRSLIRQVVVDWFGPRRCMVALNWWKDAAMSDSDGWSQEAPAPCEYLMLLKQWFSEFGLSEEDQDELFCGTARRFYRF